MIAIVKNIPSGTLFTGIMGDLVNYEIEVTEMLNCPGWYTAHDPHSAFEWNFHESWLEFPKEEDLDK
jgi:hypothetical protein